MGRGGVDAPRGVSRTTMQRGAGECRGWHEGEHEKVGDAAAATHTKADVGVGRLVSGEVVKWCEGGVMLWGRGVLGRQR